MSLESVRQFFVENAPDIEIIELNQHRHRRAGRRCPSG